MSYKTRKRLLALANLLEKLTMVIITSIELVMQDLVFGKARYRRREPRARPVVRTIYNQTIVYRDPVRSELMTPPKHRTWTVTPQRKRR